MVAMHTSLLMATLVMLVEVAAMHNHMSLLLMVTMHTSIFMPMIPLMVLFAMHIAHGDDRGRRCSLFLTMRCFAILNDALIDHV